MGYPHPRDSLAAADAAFIGDLVERRPVDPPRPGEPESLGDHVYTFRVTEAIKGPLGPTVDVISGANGGTCGIPARPDEPTGLFLWRDGAVWRSSSCGGTVAPDQLRAAAVPLPAPRSGSGPVALLVGGGFRGGRLLALDRDGRTLGRGSGGGVTTLLSLCPGSGTVAEVVRKGRKASVAIRDVRTLGVRREVRLPASALGTFGVRAARCVDRRGERVVLFAGGVVSNGMGVTERGRLLELRSAEVRVLHRVRAADAALSDRYAYLLRGRRDSLITRLELVTGRQRRLGRANGLVDGLALSPTGKRLAFHETRLSGGGSGGRTRLVALATRPDAPGRRSREVMAAPATGRIVWLEDGRLASVLSDRVTVYNARLSLQGSFSSWTASSSASRAGRLYGADRGYLLLAPLPDGPSVTVRRLPRPVRGAFFPPVSVVPVPGRVHLSAPPTSRPRTAIRATRARVGPVSSGRSTAPWCRAKTARFAS